MEVWQSYAETVVDPKVAAGEYGMATGVADDALVYRFVKMPTEDAEALLAGVKFAINGGLKLWDQLVDEDEDDT